MYWIVWRHEVTPGRETEYERIYGPAGAWVELFRRGAGYLGTLLLKATDSPGSYLTIDLWISEAAYRAFRERCSADYEALDRGCAELTERETHLGTFTSPPG